MANGHVWTDVLQLEAKSSVASVLRGIGPARQSATFDLQRAFSLESGCGAVPQGPVDTICALEMGCFWMLREIELSLALDKHLSVDEQNRIATLVLPCSKTDPSAVGCERSWGCVCDGSHRTPCGFHVAAEQKRRNCDRLLSADRSHAMPLFPSNGATVAHKDAVVTTIENVVLAYGGLTLDAEGRRKFGGHSMRVTGAQMLAAMGIELLTIMCLAVLGADALEPLILASKQL